MATPKASRRSRNAPFRRVAPPELLAAFCEASAGDIVACWVGRGRGSERLHERFRRNSAGRAVCGYVGQQKFPPTGRNNFKILLADHTFDAIRSLRVGH